MPPVTYHCSIAGRRQLLSGRHNQSLRSANTQGGGSWKRGEQTHETAKAHSGGNALGETARREISVVKFLLVILQEAVLLPHCSTSHARLYWAMLGHAGMCWARAQELAQAPLLLLPFECRGCTHGTALAVHHH